jgi:hypothetical protein
MMNPTNEQKLEWFGGNTDALNLLHSLVDLVHIWDDLIDKDKPVTDSDINKAFLTALVYIPANPFYKTIEAQVLPMWVTAASAFEVANKFEKDKDEHGIEIAHNLRYAAGHVVAYMSIVCVGYENSKKFIPDIWKTIVDDRFEDYRKEHLDVVL